MRRILLILALILCLHGIVRAEKIQRVEFHFSPDNFYIEYLDSMVAVSHGLINATNLPGAPAIPLHSYDVPVPEGMEMVDFKIQIPDTISICKGKLLAKNSELSLQPSPTRRVLKRQSCDDLKGAYPEQKIRYYNNGFDFYSFEYNAETKELLFTPTIIIDMILRPVEVSDTLSLYDSSQTEEIIKLIIHQGNDEVKLQTLKLDDNFDIIEDENIVNPIDYLIITYQSFEGLFDSLLKWKTQKGLRCAIKYVEDIEEEYKDQGESIQEKIKAYIYDMYKNHGTSYVLIGGNLPIAYAKIEQSNLMPEGSIPTDLYYACFDGQFNWDANGNGVLGEMTDNASLTPNLIVTRLPVSTPQVLLHEK